MCIYKLWQKYNNIFYTVWQQFVFIPIISFQVNHFLCSLIMQYKYIISHLFVAFCSNQVIVVARFWDLYYNLCISLFQNGSVTTVPRFLTAYSSLHLYCTYFCIYCIYFNEMLYLFSLMLVSECIHEGQACTSNEQCCTSFCDESTQTCQPWEHGRVHETNINLHL